MSKPRLWKDLPKVMGDRLICELCGADWANLGAHLWQGHGLTTDEYRGQFRIASSVPLLGATTQARFKRAAQEKHQRRPHLLESVRPDPKVRAAKAAVTRQRRKAMGILNAHGERRQYQCQRCGRDFSYYASDPRVSCFREACIKETKRLTALKNRGQWSKMSPATQKRKLRILHKAGKLATEKRRKPPHPCSICGARTPGMRVVCSDECLRESRRRTMRRLQQEGKL